MAKFVNFCRFVSSPSKR